MIALAIIVAVIFLICMIPVGADIGYENNVLSLSAKFCGVFLQLLPKDENKPKKDKKPKKEKKPKENKPEKEKKAKKELPLKFTFDDIVALLKKVFKGLGKFTRFKVDRFLLHYVAACGDPYTMTVNFGKINALLDALAPVCREMFACDDVDVYTDIDYTADSKLIEFGLGFSIRIGQIFGAINTIIFGALGIIVKVFFRTVAEKFKLKLHRQSSSSDSILETENVLS